MKLSNCSKIKVLLVVILAAIVIDDGNVNADITFGEPTNLGSIINTRQSEYGPNISTDGLTLFFSSNQPGGVGGGTDNYDIYMATRTNTSDAWQKIVNLGWPVNSQYSESTPCVSADGLELYFSSDRPDGSGSYDLYVATRDTTEVPWREVVNLGSTVNSSASEIGPSISFDGLELYFSDGSTGPYRDGSFGYADVWVTTRASLDQPWSSPTNLGQLINTSDTAECDPSISADSRVLFFKRFMLGGSWEDFDIYMSMRKTKNDLWTAATNLGPGVNTLRKESNPCISADGSILYFVSTRDGGIGTNDIWQVSVIPIVDFNSDGNIDTDDLLIMMDNWDTDESLCDIGPMPWGDGVVDMEDLTVFIEYWEQENFPEYTEDDE